MALPIRSLSRFCQAALPLSSFGRRLTLSSYSNRNLSNITLGQSTVLLQDGIEIQELPWVIRRLGPREFPFTNVAYADNEIRLHTEQEDAFERLLHECSTVKQVIRLLEVPGEQVTVHSAAFALRRICELKDSTSDDIDSFIRKAIFNELCETVIHEIERLSSDMVVSMARCCLKSASYDDQFVDRINEEIEHRLGDSRFSIIDLCNLILHFSENIKGDVDLTQMFWIHLGSRYKEINEDNITSVYQVMRYITPKFRYLFRIVDKQLQSCWWKLNAVDVATIAQRLAVGHYQSNRTLSAFGKWLYTNVHTVNDSQMKDILTLYTYFNFSDANVITSLEKYVVAKALTMNRTLIAMVMDYCQQKRFLSPLIFDAVANSFEKQSFYYQSFEAVMILRVFGQMTYAPSNASAFFQAIEHLFDDRFAELEAASFLELLASCIHLQRFPRNFIKQIFTPHFVSRVKSISDPTVRHKACCQLLLLQASVLLEFPNSESINLIDRDSLKVSLTWQEGRIHRFLKEVGTMLNGMNSFGVINESFIPRYTPHVIDFEIITGVDKQPLKAGKSTKDTVVKLALIGVMPEHYCINTGHLLGEQSTKKRHLEKLNYNVIMMKYETFMWKCRTPAKKLDYLKELLSPYIAFPDKSLSESSPEKKSTKKDSKKTDLFSKDDDSS